jgi:splicing factor 3B subunit 2
MKEKKPGILSSDLLTALGMQDGVPPPWLINMQRYGPPPSYPNLRIPGLNAPIPPGASYGSQPGQWGQPPVDQYGRPLYGDPFGTAVTQNQDAASGVDKKYLWGGYEFEEEEQGEEDEEDEEDEDEEEGDEEAAAGGQRGRGGDTDDGLETPATIADSSWISGLDATESIVDLRKRIGGLETPDTAAGNSRELYQVIKESKAQVNASGQIFGSDRLYTLPGQSNGGDVSVKLGQTRDGMDTEDDAARGSRKRKAETSLVSKKAKEFKF